MINTLKIKGRMVELGITQKDLAKELGIATPTVSQKINNARSMKLEEAEKISVLLKINETQFSRYFFYNPCCTMQQETRQRS